MMKRRMLVVLAHPDDESFGMGGTLARYAQEGVEITLICATNGDVGTVEPRFLEGYASISDLRLAELDCATQILKLHLVTKLGYRDSGMPGSPDNLHPNSLMQADHSKLTGQIVSTIRETRPQVVVTFDPYGGYGHPDHIKIHQATVDAFRLAGDPARYPDQLSGKAVSHHPGKLYYMTFSRRYMKILITLMTILGWNLEQMGRNHDINIREIASHEYPIHAYIDSRRYKKMAQMASQCHESQLGGLTSNPIINLLRGLLTPGEETFMRAYPSTDGQVTKERDLFVSVQ